MTTTRHLSTAEDRQQQVVEAAMGVFAERGFRGATTAEVARAAGISQAYVHKLFPTKSDLSLAVARRCFVKTEATFREAGTRAKARGEDVLEAMGLAYAQLMADPTSLLVQQHSFAASATDPAVREAVRDGFAQLYALVSGLSGASDDEVRAWFAQGMLINVLMALDAPAVDEPWAKALVGDE